MIAKIPAEPDDVWCDPCLGEGVFFDNFPYAEYGGHHWYEIDKGKNFLDAIDDYDWCVTNIPFSKPKEFIFKMAYRSKKGFGILCLANSMTVTRLQQLEKMGFYVYSITPLYVKSWGFGYRTDFYVFTRKPNGFESIII